MYVNQCTCHYDEEQLEQLILTIFRKYDFKINSNSSSGTTSKITMGLLGGIIGGSLGGIVGSTLGTRIIYGAIGAAGGATAAVSLYNNWSTIKSKLSILFFIVYNHLRSVGIETYMEAALFILNPLARPLVTRIADAIEAEFGRRVTYCLSSALSSR